MLIFLTDYTDYTDTEKTVNAVKSVVNNVPMRQLLATVDNFALSLNRSEQIDSVLLDFSKAFDKVNHRKLLLILELYYKK